MKSVKSMSSSLVLSAALSAAIVGCDNSQDAAPSVVGNPAGVANEVAAAPVQLPQAQRATSAVCKSGAKLRDDSDAQKIVTGAPGVLLSVKSDSVFNIQIPQAVQLYKASEGRVPKNHAEFVAKILEPNNLKLPELIDGMVYQFNPEKEELWAYPKDQVPTEK